MSERRPMHYAVDVGQDEKSPGPSGSVGQLRTASPAALTREQSVADDRRLPATDQRPNVVPGASATTNREPTRQGFRRDVEGLRAVAILLVVLYHAHAGVPGGYVGVDVFFVISGFLITRQLARELRANGRISFAGFYARRARRILPAATVTTIVTVIAAGILLSPLPAIRVFSDARSAAVFGANIHFAARDANYFNDSLPPSPLQHYWSLSVEEQFYVVWPLLLVLSSLAWLGGARRLGGREHERLRTHDRAKPHKRRPRPGVIIVVLCLLGAASFLASLVQTPESPSWAYYSIFTRAWELAAGALVALSAPLARRLDGRLAIPLTWIGVGLIACAAMTFNGSTPYPGAAALLPVGGAVAIIGAGAAATRRWGAEALLGVAPAQRVGSWSYSWYLWHWPILILAPGLLGHPLSELEALIMVVISLIVAVVCFFLIERPIRRVQLIVRRPALGLAAGAALVGTTLGAIALSGPVFASLSLGPPAASPALTAHRTLTASQLAADLRNGVGTKRVPSNLTPPLTEASKAVSLIVSNGCSLQDAGTRSKPCIYGDTASHTSVVMFGDSHAAAWFPALNLISKQEHWRLVVLTKAGCPPAAVALRRHNAPYRNCTAWRRNSEHQIAAMDPALVVITTSRYLGGAKPLSGVPTGYGNTWENGMAATFRVLHRSAHRVLFISDGPRLSQSAPDCVSGHLSDVRPCTTPRRVADYYPKARTEDLALARRYHIDSIEPTSWFCTPTRCPVIVGNILLYRDDAHMVPAWSRFIAPVLAHSMLPIMQARPASRQAG
jgi:peptidoglycan/LPS O-acetylase OafA/YrhL